MIPEAAASPPAGNVFAVSLRFLRRARPYLGRIALTLVIVLVATGAKTLLASLISPVIDEHHETRVTSKGEGAHHPFSYFHEVKQFFKPRDWDIRTVGSLAVTLSVIMFVFGSLRDYMTNWLTNRIVADLRNDVAQHLAFLPLRFHYDRKSGDLVSRITNDVNVCENATNFLFDDAIVHPVMISGALFACFWINFKLAAMACAFFPFYVVILGRLSRRMRKARKKSLEHLGDMTGTMIQTFSGIKVVKAFNTEVQQVAEFKAHNENYFRRLMTALSRKALGDNLNALFMGLAVTVVLVGGSEMLRSNVLTAGQLAFFGLAIAMINSSVREMSKSYNRLVDASAGAERVFHLLDQPRETEHDQGLDLPKVDSVEFRKVSFSYNSAPVLQDISLGVRPGEVVAVVGRSGAGKTTLCDLLCRFYDPQEGEILVSGIDLRQVRRSSLLAHVAVVTQETFLFNTSIGENIRYGRRSATEQDVEASARAANIHEFIQGLEKGYSTPVGERGAKLSGGQRQRIAIARAILRDPSLLVLDEATSSLDAESERAVQEALDRLLRSERRMTFVIAHRLSTIKNADRILVLDQGRLVEQGRHEDLLAAGGVYASLYRTQFTD